MFFWRTVFILWLILIHAFFMLAVEFRCPAPIHFRSKLPRYHHRPDGCFQKRSPYTSQQHATKTGCFYQLQLLKLHHIFHDLGGSDDVFVQLRTNLEISTEFLNNPVVTQYLHQWTLSSTLEMAFFPGMKLRLNQGIIGCSPNSVPMLFVGFEGFYGESWSFLGIIIQGVCPTIPWPNQPWLLQLSFPAVLCQNTGNTGGRPHHFSQATTLSPCKPPDGTEGVDTWLDLTLVLKKNRPQMPICHIYIRIYIYTLPDMVPSMQQKVDS